MTPGTILGIAALYFAALLGVAWWTSRRADAAGYFVGNRKSPWLVVALGLIGDSLSGVTYISVPGKVGVDQFKYLQVVLGYALGYIVIAQVLLPLYYRLKLISIYGYLGARFGPAAQQTGAFFFLLSRLLGSAARMYLAVSVFQRFVFDPMGVPFVVTTAGILLLILAYTIHGGIKTLVWTDMLQSGFLVLGVLLSIYWIGRDLDLGLVGLVRTVADSELSTVFDWDWRSRSFFFKQLFSGAAIAVVMTGLDQNNMQKSLSCPTVQDARKNLYVFAVVMVFVNVFFLALGALLYEYANLRGVEVPLATDTLFPLLALQHLGLAAGVVFIVGLTAATFNSADSVLTTLTTSFCYDFLKLHQRMDLDDRARDFRRHCIHGVFAGLLLVVILGFRAGANEAVIDLVLGMAGYTYGPLLALFGLGLATRVRVSGPAVPLVCVLSPMVCYWVQRHSEAWLGGYRVGFELLLFNAMLTAVGLKLVSWVQHRDSTDST